MANPIDLTVNAPFLEPFGTVLARHGADVASNELAAIRDCERILIETAGLPAEQAARIVAGLHELATS